MEVVRDKHEDKAARNKGESFVDFHIDELRDLYCHLIGHQVVLDFKEE